MSAPAYAVTMNCARSICDLFPVPDTPEDRAFDIASVFGVLMAYLVAVLRISRESLLALVDEYSNRLADSYADSVCAALSDRVVSCSESALQQLLRCFDSPAVNPMYDLCKVFYTQAGHDFDITNGLAVASFVTQYAQDIHPFIKCDAAEPASQSGNPAREKRFAVICICVSVVVLIAAVCVTFSV